MLGGDWLGAYCLSEPQAGSDVSGIRTRAVPRRRRRTSSTAPSSGSATARCADYYILFARTSDDAKRGLSAFVVPADTAGMSFGAPEKKMGLACDVTTQVIFDGARHPGRPADRRGGRRACGSRSRRLDAGRLGIAAVAHRHRPGGAGARGRVRRRAASSSAGRSASSRGCSSCSPTWPPTSSAARATYLHAARLKDAGRPFCRQASDRQADRDRRRDAGDDRRRAGARRQRLHPRTTRSSGYFRDAKVTQIFEGTNQIQRMVIGRDLLR